jgi:hypothetical protein
LYSVFGGPQSQGIYLSSIDAKDSRRLVDARESSAVYAEPGFLLFRRETTLVAQAFDAQKLQVSGEPIPIAEQVGFEAYDTSDLLLSFTDGRVGFQHWWCLEKHNLLGLIEAAKRSV